MLLCVTLDALNTVQAKYYLPVLTQKCMPLHVLTLTWTSGETPGEIIWQSKPYQLIN